VTTKKEKTMSEIQVQKHMVAVNTARGRKGAWHMKNTTQWSRKDNKAAEAVARQNAEFIHGFINDEHIVVEDTMAIYALGQIHEVDGFYEFDLLQSPADEVLGVMAAGAFLVKSKQAKA
jgi:hypothetical protein